jgi:hypothetical protein
VVCDGAGSAAHSEIGAETASERFIELVCDYFNAEGSLLEIDRDTVVTWLSDVANRLTTRAHAEGKAPKDYSCTLIAAIIGSEAAAFAQVGDGAIVVRDREADSWTWVFWPQHGEYANQTVFVLSANAAEAMEFNVGPRRIEDLAIFSDGIERMVLNSVTKAVNGPFFDQMFAPVRASVALGLDESLSKSLRGYLGSAIVNARTSDDKSLLMATRGPREIVKA